MHNNCRRGEFSSKLTDAEIDEIREYATSFRNAFDKAVGEGCFSRPPFNRFPNGCCGDTSDLLARFLFEESALRCKVVNGVFRDCEPELIQQHAWIEIDDWLVVDITADQFAHRADLGCFEQHVFVGPEGWFHEQFEDRSDYCFIGFESFHPVACKRLNELYGIVVSRLEL